jgi:hypothetical protein
VLCWFRIPLGPHPWLRRLRYRSLRLFVGFVATVAGSDFSRACIIGYLHTFTNLRRAWARQKASRIVPASRAPLARLVGRIAIDLQDAFIVDQLRRDLSLAAAVREYVSHSGW